MSSMRSRAAAISRIACVIGQNVDMLVLHEGPHGDDEQRGNAEIHDLVDAGDVPLTVCGHSHWSHPLANISRGQVLNVDARVIVLCASTPRD
jgi:hypothetical protein